jgi:hypothetical protein
MYMFLHPSCQSAFAISCLWGRKQPSWNPLGFKVLESIILPPKGVRKRGLAGKIVASTKCAENKNVYPKVGEIRMTNLKDFM